MPVPALAPWLLTIAAPIAKEVLIKLGFAVVSYAAVSTSLHYALDMAKGSFVGADSRAVGLIATAGFFEAMSIIGGAALAAVALQQVKKLQFVGT